jgi:FkbM family methyltransferase
MLAIKYLLKYPYQILKHKAGRALLKTMLLYSHVKRYKKTKIKYLGLYFDVADVRSFLYQLEEIFVQESYKFITKTNSPNIIDCGANVGSSIAFYKKQWPQAQVLAFEADPAIAAICQQNIQNNNWQNVQLQAKAVWLHNQGLEMVLEGADAGSLYGQSAQKTLVPTVRLKSVLELHPTVDFLKIDIEGAEVDVIIDAEPALANVQHIFIEYHSFVGKEQDLHKILEVLSRQNFRYFVRDAQDRRSPLANKTYKNNNWMDLQLNIHGYKNDKKT